MPRGIERPQPPHPEGYARLRRLMDGMQPAGGRSRALAVASPSASRFLPVAAGASLLLVLLAFGFWFGRAPGGVGSLLHSFCRF